MGRRRRTKSSSMVHQGFGRICRRYATELYHDSKVCLPIQSWLPAADADMHRNDKTKPWEEHPDDPELSFCKLNKKVDVLTRKLPATLKLSSSVLEVHIHRRRATAYFLMHTTLLICKMALHREYLPFITGPKSYPEGPIDGPRWEELQANAPPEFWKDSARSFFRATSDCFDLITSCKQRGALVETPLTAWVCFTVSFSSESYEPLPRFEQRH